VGFQHGLGACVILNPGTPNVSDGAMAGTVQAIIGAVDLDGDSEAVMQVVTRLGLVHPVLTPVTSNSPFPYLNETIYTTIDLVTSSALPLATSMSCTHSIAGTLATMNCYPD